MKPFIIGLLLYAAILPSTSFAQITTPTTTTDNSSLEDQRTALMRQLIALLQMHLELLIKQLSQQHGITFMPPASSVNATTSASTTEPIVKRRSGGGGGGGSSRSSTPTVTTPALVLDMAATGTDSFRVTANQSLDPVTVSVTLLDYPGLATVPAMSQNLLNG